MSRPFKRAGERRKPRSVGLDDVTWNAIKQIARAQGLSVSAVVADSLGNKIRRWKMEKQEAAS
jgi:predicted DNA-binding ribbon-helix-helix protein